jgi:hypothetical protein
VDDAVGLRMMRWGCGRCGGVVAVVVAAVAAAAALSV